VESHWFEPLAEFMGPTYLRYSFTKGTVQEVDFLIHELQLPVGSRILDVGCGPGRHSLELARRGYLVHGVDISQTFIDLARQENVPGATFERLDARDLPFADEFDAVICLCQGAFGLMTAQSDDQMVLRKMGDALKSNGRLVMSAFNSYFAVKYFDQAVFDAGTGINHERTEIRNPEGKSEEVDLWTGCYTPRELRLMCKAVDLEVEAVYSVDPGAYRQASPSVESSEFLVVAFPSPFRRKGALISDALDT
jgi:SAM-dependent methyltransferase